MTLGPAREQVDARLDHRLAAPLLGEHVADGGQDLVVGQGQRLHVGAARGTGAPAGSRHRLAHLGQQRAGGKRVVGEPLHVGAERAVLAQRRHQSSAHTAGQPPCRHRAAPATASSTAWAATSSSSATSSRRRSSCSRTRSAAWTDAGGVVLHPVGADRRVDGQRRRQVADVERQRLRRLAQRCQSGARDAARPRGPAGSPLSRSVFNRAWRSAGRRRHLGQRDRGGVERHAPAPARGSCRSRGSRRRPPAPAGCRRRR